MKKLFLFIALLITVHVNGQEAQFFDAVKSDDFTLVLASLDNKLEVCINDDQDLYSKNVAIQRIKNWIKEVNVIGVNPMHGGESEGRESHYKVAKIDTKQGSYRLFVYVENEGRQSKIKKIQIDKY